MSTPVTSVIASNTNFGSEGTAATATENAAPKPGEVYAYRLHDIMTCAWSETSIPFLFYEPWVIFYNLIIIIISTSGHL